MSVCCISWTETGHRGCKSDKSLPYNGEWYNESHGTIMLCMCMKVCVFSAPLKQTAVMAERESHFDVHPPDESILTGNQIYHLIKLSRRVLQGWCKVDRDMQSWFECVCVCERALQGLLFHIRYIKKCVPAISCLCIHAMMKENSFYHSNYSLIFKKTEPIMVTLILPMHCPFRLVSYYFSLNNYPPFIIFQ